MTRHSLGILMVNMAGGPGRNKTAAGRAWSGLRARLTQGTAQCKSFTELKMFSLYVRLVGRQLPWVLLS